MKIRLDCYLNTCGALKVFIVLTLKHECAKVQQLFTYFLDCVQSVLVLLQKN